MIIKINLAELQNYFGLHFPGFENSMLFDQLEIDLQTDPLTKEFQPVYDGIKTLCREYGLAGLENDLFGVFLVSTYAKSQGEFMTEYKTIVTDIRELFRVFDSMVSVKFRKINEKISISIKGQRIESKSLLKDYKQTIFNKVTATLKKPNWNQLPQHEKIQIVETVKTYLEATKPQRGQPQKTMITRKFIFCFRDYLQNIVPDQVFKSGRQFHLFLGKLTVLYGILPEPDESQQNQGNEYFIKIIENHLPK